MFRVKLSLAIATLLAVILILAGALYWGMQRSGFYSQRSQLAYDALEAYVLLSHDAYRHFKEMLDIVVLEGEASIDDTRVSHQTLLISLSRLKNATFAEIDLVDGKEKINERDELRRIDELEKLLHEGIAEFERAVLLTRMGSEVSSRRVLSDVLKQTIDQQFRPLIDAAIKEEHEEVMVARQQGEQLLYKLKIAASVSAVLATFFALMIGVILLRSLNLPLDTLVSGVRKVAKGDLSHRIVLHGRSEFTYLAKNFNEMTSELARQRQQLLLAKAELEQKVELRTREWQETNKKLMEIDEGRRRFFADISHELRTPLTAIRGEAEVTGRGKDKSADEYRDALRRIVDLSAQLAQLVDDLLLLARSESVNTHIELRPLQIDELLAGICDDAQVLARKKRLDLHLDLPEQPVLLQGDVLRLRQLLLILLDNACRYSKPDGIIRVILVASTDVAEVSVVDQGIGITENEQGMVFERFFRGDLARKLVPSGTGLGLSLARSIVQAHNGQISLESKPERGTRVIVTLPLLRSGNN